MNKGLIIIILIAYLGLLFFLAYWAEKNKRSKWVNNPYIYALSLAVYCSAWTYYGSVGAAARGDYSFLTVYLGPIIAAPLWIVVLKKIVTLSKVYNVSSIADFISLRYANNRSLGALVTLVCAASIIPYVALQLKAISETYGLITANETITKASPVIGDSTFYIAILLAVFVAFFGTLSLDASKQKKGVVFSVAMESLLKLVIFLIIGVYVSFYLFKNPGDITQQVAHSGIVNPYTGVASVTQGLNWLFMIALSFLAIFLLPRQFQVAVVEQSSFKQIKKGVWVFPLYLLLFNIFVVFIAWGGLLLLGSDINYDYITMMIPLSQGNYFLATLVFLGGFSAVISMIVISTLALSTMLSNNLIIPYGFINRFTRKQDFQNIKTIKTIRRVSIFVTILLGYGLYASFNPSVSLYAIGLISFLVIAQLAPAFFLGLYWNRGSSKGAAWGVLVGLLMVVFTYIVPFITDEVWQAGGFVNEGLFGIAALKPHALFGIDFLEKTPHTLFWSLLLNTFCFVFISLVRKGNYRERNYGEIFVHPEKFHGHNDEAYVWKGEANFAEIKSVLVRFLGEHRTNRAIQIFKKRNTIHEEVPPVNAKFIDFSEKLLTGAVGTSSARILIGKVSKEQPVSLNEVLHILEENKETTALNKALKEKSLALEKITQKLSKANAALLLKDKQKDDFLDTVAHELKTPITSMHASAEVLEDEEMPPALRKQFLKNILNDSERLTRLINDILNLERLSSGKLPMTFEQKSLKTTIERAIASVEGELKKKAIEVQTNLDEVTFNQDEDRLIQVIVNLFSNSFKFLPDEHPKIKINLNDHPNEVEITFWDNGKGIDEKDIPYVFEKFYQSENQTLKKPKGSGFGLAICKQIIKSHGGTIEVDQTMKNGTNMIIKLPKT